MGEILKSVKSNSEWINLSQNPAKSWRITAINDKKIKRTSSGWLFIAVYYTSKR